MDLLGKERAIEPAWELNKYFIHGGGIAIFGEMSWNGGYFCVWLTTTLVLLLAYLGDTRRDHGFEWLILYCMYASCLGYGVGYGLTYLFCGVSNGLIVIVVYRMFRRATRVAGGGAVRGPEDRGDWRTGLSPDVEWFKHQFERGLPMNANLKDEVRDFWDRASCGEIYAQGSSLRERLDAQAKTRYALEP